ncbi:MAG: hypothetical protein H0W84_05850 [Bacteroidetes bacterium]|nr:hypothetical protein [Bacteroidota bacterium]
MRNFLKLSFITAVITLSSTGFAQEGKPAKGGAKPVVSQTSSLENAFDTQSTAPAEATTDTKALPLEKKLGTAANNASPSESTKEATPKKENK